MKITGRIRVWYYDRFLWEIYVKLVDECADFSIEDTAESRYTNLSKTHEIQKLTMITLKHSGIQTITMIWWTHP